MFKKYKYRGNYGDGLKIGLDNPPIGCEDQAVKDRSFQLVWQCLNGIKAADIKKHVDSLSDDQANTLMKYIYRGMSFDESAGSEDAMAQRTRATQCAGLLTWHAAVLAKTGHGAIVRAIAQRY